MKERRDIHKKWKFTPTRPVKSLSLNTGQGGRLFVKCTHLENHNLTTQITSGDSLNMRMRLRDISGSHKFQRFASMYSFFRVHKMSVRFSATGAVPVMMSVVSLDDDVLMQNQTQYEIQKSVRVHHLLDNKSQVSRRTLDLFAVDNKFREQLPTAGATNRLAFPDLQACIKYGCFGVLHKAGQSITVEESFVVEFIGMRDTIETGRINGIPGTGSIDQVAPAVAVNAGLPANAGLD
jgi:hypothetical protein